MATEKRDYKTNRRRWGQIEKRGDAYRARYTGPDGERYTSPLFTTTEDADVWLAVQRSLISAGKWKSPRQVDAERFGPYAETWIKQRVTSTGKPLAPRTRTGYERHLKNGLAEFADLPIPQLTPAVVRAWHARRHVKGATQAAREAALLRAILSTAVEDRIIEENPVPAKTTKGSTGIKHRPPTAEELAVIVDAMPAEWQAAVLIAAFGGLRLSEWRALRRMDLTTDKEGRYLVNVERQAVRITGEGWHVGPPKSEEGVRTVTLPGHVSPAITRHLADHTGPRPDALLFAPTGESAFIDDQRFNRPWAEAREKAGAHDVREHDLRAFAGTAFAQGGATLRETMKFLGHSTTAAAMAYQATTGRDAELADRMPALPIVEAGNVTPIRRAGGAG